MKINFVTYADFFESTNLAGKRAMLIYSFLENKNAISKVLVRDAKTKSSKIIKVLPLGSLLPKIFSFLEKFITYSFRHNIIEKIYDYFIYLKLRNTTNGIIYYDYPNFSKSIKKLKKNNTIIVNANCVHPNYLSQIGLKPNKSNKNVLIESFGNADYIFSFSNFTTKTLVANGIDESKIFLVNNGFYLKDTNFKRKYRKKIDKLKILYTGAINKFKGINSILEGVKGLKIPFELLLVGDVEKSFKKTVSKYIDYKNIKFLGFKKNLEKYYESADIFLFPSLVEGSAKVTYEAMYYGLPLITTKNAGSVVRDGIDGFIIPAKSSEDIKEKIEFFYNNPDSIKKMGKSARDFVVNNYTWEHFSDRVYNALQEVMKRENQK